MGVIADQLMAYAAQIQELEARVAELEAQVARYRRRDEAFTRALTRRAEQLAEEAAHASQNKSFYFNKRIDDHEVFKLMLGMELSKF